MKVLVISLALIAFSVATISPAYACSKHLDAESGSSESKDS